MTGNMAHLFSDKSEQTLVRIMLYGQPKTRKTWWVGKAAEAGFNVILMDGDNGFHILKEVPETIRNNRIVRIACYDDIGRPAFSPFVINLLKRKKFLWNDTDRTEPLGTSNLKENCGYAYLDLTKLTNKDILVLDSWTKYCVSLDLRYALENQIDLTKAEKWEWDGYQYSGMLVDWTLNSLASLPCHVVVIGHETQYEKYRGTGRERTLVSSTMVMKSSSNPKAMTVPSGFSDILYFKIHGGFTKIDTRAEADRIGGSRGIAPGTYDWDKLQFADVCKAYNIGTPGNPEREYDCEVVNYFPPGEPLPESIVGKPKIVATVGEPVVQGSTATKVTFSQLLKKS